MTALSMPTGTVYPFNHRSLLRKPEIGMLAVLEHECWKRDIVIDWDNSLMVGDRPEDQQLAERAGVAYLHIDEFLKLPIV